MKAYIYLITDKIKNKPYYVGKHNGEIKNYITGSKILNRYISIFGLESFFNRFDRSIIQYCNIENINLLEEQYIKSFKTYNNGGNLTEGGRYDLKYRIPKKKKVLQYDLEGNFIKEWSSGKEAWRNTNIKSYGDISACCTGKQKTAGGFIWKYKKGNIQKKINPFKRKKYKKGVTRIKSQSIKINNKEYNSITQAALDLGYTFGKLNGMIKNNQIKYKWLKK